MYSQGTQDLTYFKSEERKFFEKNNMLPIPDNYGVVEYKKLGKSYYFGEFQINESGNKWDKDYRSLFKTFSEDQILSLMVVTTGSYDLIKQKLTKEMHTMKNVRLEFYTLDKLKEVCWRTALKAREEYRQKELTK